jgi:uncharacterized membrane protein/predicted DsbA family dithiol-disulfide isomerase
MANRVSLLLFRLAVLVALAVSTALLIDFFRPLPAFCDVGSGCDQIRASGRGKLFGLLPFPVLGVAGFAILMILSLLPSERAARLTRVFAVVAGGSGIALLGMQAFQLKVFCKLCVTVDSAAIVAAASILVFAFTQKGATTEAAAPLSSTSMRWLWPGATVAAMLLPGGWALFQPSPPVPREVASLWQPDKINVVEFVDFQCPFCRQLHPSILELLDEYGSRVNFVRLNMPLANHPHARTAARAYCCADQQQKGTAMADALIKSDDLTPEGCEKMATQLGLSLADYKGCVTSPATEARIDDEIARVKSAGLAGLPTVWVEDQAIVGFSPDHLRDAFTRAATDKPRTRLPTSLLWASFAVALGVVGALAMRSRGDDVSAR